jgi:hypothetical protein
MTTTTTTTTMMMMLMTMMTMMMTLLLWSGLPSLRLAADPGRGVPLGGVPNVRAQPRPPDDDHVDDDDDIGQ